MDKTKITQTATRYVQKGQYDKAIAEYRRLVEKDPKDVRSLLKIGELQQKKGDNEAAAATLLEVGNSYASEGFFLKAVAVFKQVVKLAPERVDVMLRLADLYKQLGLMSDSMAQLQAAAAHYEKTGAMNESVEILRRLTALEPDNVAARLRLADALVRKDDRQEALKELRNTAGKLRGSSRLEDYLRVADKIVQLDPKDQALGRELAHAYLAKSDVRRALERLQVCFQQDPKNVETLELLARAFVGVGQRAKAASVYKELARVHAERGRGADEQACWRKVLEVAPDDPEARQALGTDARPEPAPVPRPPAPPRLERSDTIPAPRAEPSWPGAQRRPEPSRPGAQAARPEPSQPSAPFARPEASRPGVQAARPEPSHPHAAFARPEPSRSGAQPVRPEPSYSAARPEPSRGVQPSSRSGTPAPIAGDGGPASEQLARLLTETDVFMRYGLVDKARLHLQKIFAIDSECIPAHEKAAELLRDRDVEAQKASLATLARLCARNGTLERGRPWFEELRSLDPAHPEVQALAPIYSSAVPSQEISEDDLIDLPDLPDEVLAELPAQDEPLLMPLGTEEAVVLEVDIAPPPAAAPSFHPVNEEALFDLASGNAALDEVVDEPLLREPSVVPDAAARDEALHLLARDEASRGPAEETIDIELPEEIEPLGDGEEPTRAAPGAGGGVEPTALALIDEAEPPTVVAPRATGAAADEPTGLALIEDDDVLTAADETAELDFDAATSRHDAIGGGQEPPTPGWRSEEGLVPEPRAAAGEEDAALNPWRVDDQELSRIAAELDEAEFYLQQGMLDEAEEIYRSVERRVPGHAQATSRLAEIAERRGTAATPGPEPTIFDRAAISSAAGSAAPAAGEDLFDLGAALAEELAEVEGPLDAFQEQVEEPAAPAASPEEVDTHYNLAIAYKEMGLFPDAIAAFEKALSGCANDPRAIDCLTMIGICHGLQGQHRHAVRAFERGLAAPGLPSETAKALHYEVALAWEAAGEKDEALAAYERVAALDGGFRDVQAAITRLLAQGAVRRVPGAGAASASAGIASRAGKR